jgi:hypothetical protein
MLKNYHCFSEKEKEKIITSFENSFKKLALSVQVGCSQKSSIDSDTANQFDEKFSLYLQNGLHLKEILV